MVRLCVCLYLYLLGARTTKKIQTMCELNGELIIFGGSDETPVASNAHPASKEVDAFVYHVRPRLRKRLLPLPQDPGASASSFLDGAGVMAEAPSNGDDIISLTIREGGEELLRRWHERAMAREVSARDVMVLAAEERRAHAAAPAAMIATMAKTEAAKANAEVFVSGVAARTSLSSRAAQLPAPPPYRRRDGGVRAANGSGGSSLRQGGHAAASGGAQVLTPSTMRRGVLSVRNGPFPPRQRNGAGRLMSAEAGAGGEGWGGGVPSTNRPAYGGARGGLRSGREPAKNAAARVRPHIVKVGCGVARMALGGDWCVVGGGRGVFVVAVVYGSTCTVMFLTFLQSIMARLFCGGRYCGC